MYITAEVLAYVIMNVNKSVRKIKQYNFQSVLVNMSRKRCVIFHSRDPNAVRYGPKNAEQFTQWKELAKGNTDWKGTNFRTFYLKFLGFNTTTGKRCTEGQNGQK